MKRKRKDGPVKDKAGQEKWRRRIESWRSHLIKGTVDPLK